MSEPEIGGREPVTVDVVAGETYWWCRCGRSQTQPFCDGSHEVDRLQAAGMDRQARGQAQFLHLQAHQDAAVLRQQPFEAIIEPVHGAIRPTHHAALDHPSGRRGGGRLSRSSSSTSWCARARWRTRPGAASTSSSSAAPIWCPIWCRRVKGYAAHERTVLEEVTQLRGAARALPEGDVAGARPGRRRAVGRARPAVRARRELSRPEGERQFPRAAAAVERRWKTKCRWRGAITTARCAISTCWCNPSPAIWSPARSASAQRDYFELSDAAERAVPQVDLAQPR